MKKILFIPLFLILAAIVSAQVKVPKLLLKQRTLPNGLRVVSHQDNSSPTVSIHVWYQVGSKDDPQGKSGFAHMFEHMMFKSTKNMPNEKMDRLTEDVGGFNNASTWDDFTNYFEVVPSNHLEVLLWAESDRMVNLNVDEANFKSEREVVKEEFRQRILANPYGMLFGQYIDQLSYSVHPYKRPGIGNLDELNAAGIDDAYKFYRDYYRPDNAVLIIVGDFNQAQLDGWIDKYFGRIAKPDGQVKRVTAMEPPRTKEVRYEKTAPRVPFPAVAITYLGPKSDDRDIAALKVAETILSGGESSRLYQEIINRQQIAQNASFEVDNRVDGGLLRFVGIASEGHTSAELEKSLLAELRKIQSAPVSARELEKAKNQLISNKLRGMEDNDGKASAIEQALAFGGSPEEVNNEIVKLQAVTAADIQRVMKKYMNDNNRVVIYYNQAEGGGK